MKLVIDIPKEYYNAIKEIPDEQSTADMLIIKNGTPLEEQKTAEWIYVESSYNVEYYRCSNCGRHFWIENALSYKFCPECGRKMKGGE